MILKQKMMIVIISAINDYFNLYFAFCYTNNSPGSTVLSTKERYIRY